MRIYTPDYNNPLEERVKEAFLNKLFYEVDDSQIFIDKEDFMQLILNDIITIAEAKYDMDKALKKAITKDKKYKENPELKKIELEDVERDYGTDIDAYVEYLDAKKEGLDDDKIMDNVYLILNSDTDLLQKKLHEVMMEAISAKLSDADVNSAGGNRHGLVDVFANQVKLIATNETIDDAVEEAYSEFEDYPKKYLVKKENIKREFERFAPLANNEISAYRMSMSLHEQNAQFGESISIAKQLLGLQ